MEVKNAFRHVFEHNRKRVYSGIWLDEFPDPPALGTFRIFLAEIPEYEKLPYHNC